MQKIIEFIKKYIYTISIILIACATLAYSFAYFKTSIGNKKVAEMYVGELKYSISIDNVENNSISVDADSKKYIDLYIYDENEVDNYYKLLYANNSNITIEYFTTVSDPEYNYHGYNSPNELIFAKSVVGLKLRITNKSSTSQTVTFKVSGGYNTNALEDVEVPNGYTNVNTQGTFGNNEFFCNVYGTINQGTTYSVENYTYSYKKEGIESSSELAWTNITADGWGVQLTDKTSTSAVNSAMCTYINNKPVISMSYAFANSKSTELNLNNINTSNIINMSNMFSNSSATTISGLDKFDTVNVKNMSYMFNNTVSPSLDISNFSTDNVTNMSYMFNESEATVLDVSNFETTNVIDMSYMFSDSTVASLNLSNFTTNNVKNMSYMFKGSQISIIDVSSFNTSNVTNMNYVFATCPKLQIIYASENFVTTSATSKNNMFLDTSNIVGGSGTVYNSTAKNDSIYAKIDGGTSSPGYFTDIADRVNQFESDSWETIVINVRNGNIANYKVGDTKEIDLGSTYGKHEVRIANISTPRQCRLNDFSETACGFVLEFTDVITEHNMNPAGSYNGTQYNYGWNIDGWPVTSMRTFINNDIFKALPEILQTSIIDTRVISSHGSQDTDNFTSIDKLYLLAPSEIYSNFTDAYDSAKDTTRQLFYYKKEGITTTNYSKVVKKNGTKNSSWRLRSAHSRANTSFYYVYTNGSFSYMGASSSYGVSPAFRLG